MINSRNMVLTKAKHIEIPSNQTKKQSTLRIQKTRHKRQDNMNLFENQRWNQVLRKGKHFLLRMRHPLWYPLCRIKEWNALMTTIAWPTDVIKDYRRFFRTRSRKCLPFRSPWFYLCFSCDCLVFWILSFDCPFVWFFGISTFFTS